MKQTWPITVLYFRRMASKPLLMVLLFCIPFTLLLAEFEAFGRRKPPTQMESLPLQITLSNHSPEADHIAHCLMNQPGEPLNITEVSAPAPDRDVLTISGSSPVTVSFHFRGTNPSSYILESSLIKLCVSEQSQVTDQLVMDRVSPPRSNSSGSFIATFFPGLALFGTLFLSQAMASLVWRDHEREVQRRLLTTPTSTTALVLGPLLFVTTGTAVSLFMILGVCALFESPAVLASPLFWISGTGFALCAAGLQIVIGLLARTQRGAYAISSSISMMLAFFGGGFVPLALYPPALAALAHVLPNGAAQNVLSQLLQNTGESGSLFWWVLIVWAWALALAILATAIQRRQLLGNH